MTIHRVSHLTLIRAQRARQLQAEADRLLVELAKVREKIREAEPRLKYSTEPEQAIDELGRFAIP